MTTPATPLDFVLLVQAGHDAGPEEVDALARQLLGELLETDVQSAGLLKGGPAPAGTKAADVAALGALAVAVLPSFLPKLVEMVQAWALRGQGRVVKFKGKVAGQDVEFEGTGEELKVVLAALSGQGGAPPAPPRPAS